MSNYTNLNKKALMDLALEKGISVTEDNTNKEIVALLEQYDIDNPPEDTSTANTTQDAPQVQKVAVKTAEVAQLEDGQVFAGVTAYGDQQGISEELKKHPKVRIMIPLMEGEPKGSTQYIGLNGASYHVTKGKMVDLPQPLAEIIDNSYKLDLGDVESLELGDNAPKELQ